MCACAAGVKQCLRVCVCVCVRKKILKNASSKVTKALTDVVVNENNQHNQIRMFVYLIQVQAVLYTVISATSYCQCSGSTPFEIAHGSLQSAMQLIRPY